MTPLGPGGFGGGSALRVLYEPPAQMIVGNKRLSFASDNTL